MGSIGNDAFHAPLKQRLAAVVSSATRHWQLERSEKLAPALDPGEAVGRRECFRRRPDT